MNQHYPLASSTWNKEEEQAIFDVVKSGQFTMGKKTEEFEKKFAEHFSSKYAVMVNSGSSANLLAFGAPLYTKKPLLKAGDEVIVPAVSWSTSFFPFSQHGLKLRFVDIDLDTLNIDLDQVEAAITPKTKAILAVNLLGNPNDFQRLTSICNDHNLILLEDNCESMGATFQGCPCGSFGLLGTFSTFFSHHISTMEGGVIVTDQEELYHILLAMRSHGWTRHLPKENCIENKSGDPFIDSFRFVLPGYNVRPTEISAAIGLKQLEKVDHFITERRANAEYFLETFQDFEEVKVQKTLGNSSWFGFSLVLEGSLAGKRNQIIKDLQASNIECRPIIAGNFTKHPAINHLEHKIVGSLDNANKIHDDGLFIGNHHYSISSQIHYLRRTLEKAALGLLV